MEGLIESLEGSFREGDPEKGAYAATSSTTHPKYADFYKNRGEKSLEQSQEKRRKDILERQKKSRLDLANRSRQLALEEFDEFDGHNEENMAEEEALDLRKEDDKSMQIRRKPREFYYRNQLMLSEWLVDIPSELTEEWAMLLSPVGKRLLVVASRVGLAKLRYGADSNFQKRSFQGVTSAYAKSGCRVYQFQSLLPGGGPKSSRNCDYTLLDCIYSEVDRAFYALDVICWRGNSVADSETEFRFYWLATKLAESPEISERSKGNVYPFHSLPYCDCTTEKMETLMKQKLPFKTPLDGLLFYHKRCHYSAGVTPLVGWLKPFMLTEILGVPLPQEYLQEMGQTTAEFIENFNEQHKVKPQKAKKQEENDAKEGENVAMEQQKSDD